MVDQLRVSQILINLIMNALKFSKKHSEVYVTVRTCADGLRVHSDIYVQDFGIGIGPEDMARLFTPYFKTTNIESL
jgi:signal transduction histidine kinase